MQHVTLLEQTIFYSLITNICVDYQCKVPLQSINEVYKQKGQIQSTLQTLQGPDIFKYIISIQNHFVLESTTNSSLCVSYQQLGLNQRSLTLLQDVDCNINNHTCTFQHTFRSRTSSCRSISSLQLDALIFRRNKRSKGISIRRTNSFLTCMAP